MKFWDSSALVPLVVEERTSRACRALVRADANVVVWALARTEILSALCRLVRQGALTSDGFDRARARLDRIAARWIVVDALAEVQAHAERMLLTHPLRAADALQLGAALVASDGQPRRCPFVSFDRDLRDAATAEGFEVVAVAR